MEVICQAFTTAKFDESGFDQAALAAKLSQGSRVRFRNDLATVGPLANELGLTFPRGRADSHEPFFGGGRHPYLQTLSLPPLYFAFHVFCLSAFIGGLGELAPTARLAVRSSAERVLPRPTLLFVK